MYIMCENFIGLCEKWEMMKQRSLIPKTHFKNEDRVFKKQQSRCGLPRPNWSIYNTTPTSKTLGKWQPLSSIVGWVWIKTKGLRYLGPNFCCIFSRYDRKAAPMQPQQYGCLDKTYMATAPADMLATWLRANSQDSNLVWKLINGCWKREKSLFLGIISPNRWFNPNWPVLKAV